jgi:hypothetical protein
LKGSQMILGCGSFKHFCDHRACRFRGSCRCSGGSGRKQP